jgi:hypothetical protein
MSGGSCHSLLLGWPFSMEIKIVKQCAKENRKLICARSLRRIPPRMHFEDISPLECNAIIIKNFDNKTK